MHSVIDAKIVPSLRSDHSAVVLKVNINTTEKGKGYWKFNNSLLDDKLYLNKFAVLWDTLNEKYNTVKSKRMKWDLCKQDIKRFSIKYSVDKAIHNKSILDETHDRLMELDKLISSAPSHDVCNEYNMMKRKLDEYYIYDLKGKQVRSRAKWIEHGEKNGKFFFGLEKRNGKRKTIKKLKQQDGQIVTNLSGISEEINKYYTILYSKREQTYDLESFLEGITMPKLTKEQKELCDKPITKTECLSALQSMTNNKSPGYDGLTVEFYKQCWPLVGELLIECYVECFHAGALSTTQSRGIITLLYKKNDPQLLKNWRPISLLCIDYKILAHVLSNRLKIVLPSIICSDQVGYIKGRRAAEVIRLIQDIYDYILKHDMPGAVYVLCITSI